MRTSRITIRFAAHEMAVIETLRAGGSDNSGNDPKVDILEKKPGFLQTLLRADQLVDIKSERELLVYRVTQLGRLLDLLTMAAMKIACRWIV